ATSPPFGSSSLITSAPRNARIWAQAGPAWLCVMSITRIFDNAFSIWPAPRRKPRDGESRCEPGASSNSRSATSGFEPRANLEASIGRRIAAMSSIRPCRDDERAIVLAIVNAGAEAYRGVIPDDCWHDPYMPLGELESEIAAGVRFWGY